MKKIIGILLFIISIVVILFIIINNIPEKNASKIPIVTFHRLVPDNIKNTKYKVIQRKITHKDFIFKL